MHIMLKKVGIGVLVSGSGSNLQSIIDHIEAGTLDAEIRVVLSNNPEAYALERCKKHQIPSVFIDHRQFDCRENYDRKMVAILESSGVELVVMAGFMRILSPEFFRAFHRRVINSIQPCYPHFPDCMCNKKQ
jgi:phosphoribosylglycinamide formyltransferase-1